MFEAYETIDSEEPNILHEAVVITQFSIQFENSVLMLDFMKTAKISTLTLAW